MLRQHFIIVVNNNKNGAQTEKLTVWGERQCKKMETSIT